MNTAKKGRRNEHRARDALTASGYLVLRAAGSKGPFDLCGIKLHGDGPFVKLVQVKSNGWPSSAERAALATLAEQFDEHAPVSCEVWRFDDRKREPFIRGV